MTSTIPRSIERGITRARAVGSCTIERAPTYDDKTKRWIVVIWLQIERAGTFVSTLTKWCVLIDETYPYGGIGFYPAAEGGITSTFPHQARNILDGKEKGWRQGKLCLDSPFRGERLKTNARDPVGDADERLRWHVERALAWLRAAAKGKLLGDGDPFELPVRPHTLPNVLGKSRIIYDESERGFSAWTNRWRDMGPLELGTIPGLEKALAANAFIDRKSAIIRSWEGRPLTRLEDSLSATWWLWPQPIVIPPWQAPDSWGELRIAGRSMGINVDAGLQGLALGLRGQQSDSILLLGYPIPLRVGSAPNEVHWDAILLPRLAPSEGKPPKGFRQNLLGWWQRDRRGPFADKAALGYLKTENWSGDRLLARGRLSPAFREANVAILGVGALGSVLAESIVRAGLTNIALIDGDLIEAGNMSRHIATLADVGQTKVKVVASRLKEISPFVRISEVENELPLSVDAIVNLLEPFDVIIDCTGSDDVLLSLSRGWWSIPRLFASFSLGFGAHRLYSFGVFANRFPADQFASVTQPWLQYETSEWAGSDELLEGPGCWSPLFPARYDDILMMASTGVQEIEAMMDRRPKESRFRVFERHVSDEGLISFSTVQDAKGGRSGAP